MATKKTALLVDHDLVEQVKELLGTTTTTRDDRRGDARGDRPGAQGRATPLRADGGRREQGATRDAAPPTSPTRARWRAPPRRRAARLVSLLVGGGIATCAGIVDLEVLRTFEDASARADVAAERRATTRASPINDAVLDRAIEVQVELLDTQRAGPSPSWWPRRPSEQDSSCSTTTTSTSDRVGHRASPRSVAGPLDARRRPGRSAGLRSDSTPSTT